MLTKSRISVETIPLFLSSTGFMHFFTNKSVTIKDKINQILPVIDTNGASFTIALDPMLKN